MKPNVEIIGDVRMSTLPYYRRYRMTLLMAAEPIEWNSLYPRTELDETIDMIAPALRCSPRVATAILSKVQKLVVRARHDRYRPQSFMSGGFTARELSLLLVALPHHYVPVIGTMQEAIEHAVLDPRRGEYALEHRGRKNGDCFLKVMRGNTVGNR